MRQEWEPEDLVGAWTLVDDDWRRIANKSGSTRLGFAVLLKFFELEARFPDGPGELPGAVVAYVAEQVGVAPLSRPRFRRRCRGQGFRRHCQRCANRSHSDGGNA